MDESRQLPHVVEYDGARPLEPAPRRQPARIAERTHAGGARRFDSEPTVLDDHAVGGGDGHSRRRVEEEVRRRLAVDDLAGAEDAAGEAIVESGEPQRVA